MNNTKRNLIIASIVFCILSNAWNLYLVITGIINFIKIEPKETVQLVSIIYHLLGIIAYIVATGLLIFCISHKGIYFRQRYSYYMSALITIFILDTLSIPSILLLCTLFISDIVYVKPHDDVYFKPDDDIIDIKPDKKEDKERERKIAELRKLKEEGKITDEEFNEQLFKLL